MHAIRGPGSSPDLSPPLRLRDVGSEAVVIAGGGAAILTQLANPAIGHAVARHSDFVAHPTRRLKHTLTFVYAVIYGTPDQVAAVKAQVNRAHLPVRSTRDDAVRYDAADADLQLFVAATLWHTFVELRVRLVGALDEVDLDNVYRDYAVIGTSLQVAEGAWPIDRAAFATYWGTQSSRLAVDDTVREVAQNLLYPKTGPLWLRASMPLARLVTAGLLSAELREAYRMPWSPRRARRFERALDTIATVNRVLPRRVREWPRHHLLAELTRRR